MKPATDILVFIEDPGAATFIQEIPSVLAEKEIKAVWLAYALAADFFRKRNIPFEPAGPSADPGEVLSRYRPRILMVGTSENYDTLGLRLIEAASVRGIVSIGFVDSPGNFANRFSGRRESATAYAPDWLLVPDARTKRYFVEVGFNAERVLVTGNPHYDHVIQKVSGLTTEDRKALRLKFFSAGAGERVILFAGELSTGIKQEQYRMSADYTLRGWGKSTGRTEIVMEEFIDAVQLIDPRPRLVLRPHPKNIPQDYEAYAGHFDQVIWDGSSLEIAYAADMVVGMSTMLLYEAALMGRQALSILPRLSERAWLPDLPSGSIPFVTTREELHNILPELLGQSSAHSDTIPEAASNCREEIAAFIAKLLKSLQPEANLNLGTRTRISRAESPFHTIRKVKP